MIEDMSDTKPCTRCHKVKPLDAFYRNKLHKTGRASWCAECAKAYQAERKDVKAAYDAEYLERNRDRVREYQRSFHAANRLRRNAQVTEYRQANPHVKWLNSYRHRARRMGKELVFEHFTRADVAERYGDKCYYCPSGRFDELDHHVAIALGGHHTLGNVRPSCRPCNQEKAWKEIGVGSKSPRGKRPLEGACNEPVSMGLIEPGYCHRPDNGSGLCNVHQAAKERGERKRRENDRLRRAAYGDVVARKRGMS